MADIIDSSGLVGGSAPWDIPDQFGSQADNCTPRYGADIRCTQFYPSQEPQAVAPYDPDLQAIANSFNSNPVKHGSDMGRSSAASPGQDGYNSGNVMPVDLKG